MKRLLTLLLSISLCLLPSTTFAAGNFFQVSDVGTSAEMIGRGNIEGFGDYANNVFDNPASLNRLNKFSASMFTTTLMNEVNYKNVAIATRVPGGVIGIGYMSADVTDIYYTDEIIFDPRNPNDSEHVAVGSFDYNNTMIKVAYQVSQTKYLHWGVSGVYYSSKIGDVEGSGFNVDAGLAIEADPLTLQATFKNALSSSVVEYNNGGEETLPSDFIVSAAYNMGEFDLFAQMKFESGTKQFGITYTPSFLAIAELSAGYKEFKVLDEVKTNTTFGIGFTVYDVKFNYAFESSEHILYNNKHYFSVGIGF